LTVNGCEDKKTGEFYIMCAERVVQLYPPKKKGKLDEYEILDRFKGIQLKDKQYEPLFNYFAKVISALLLPNLYQ